MILIFFFFYFSKNMGRSGDGKRNILWGWPNKANSHTSKVEIHTRSKLCHFVGLYVVRAKLFCLKNFVPVTGLECSYGKIFIPVTEISVAKTEISVTGPARPLIWTHRYFYKEKSGEARSRKPSQPGWPGSYEEALRGVKVRFFLVSKHRDFIVCPSSKISSTTKPKL